MNSIDNCPICCGEIKNIFVLLNCNCRQVLYHPDCISEWFKYKRNCPTCKFNFKKAPVIGYNKQKCKQLNTALFLDSINKYNSLYIADLV